MRRPLVLAAGVAAFAMLATLNSAGYRYGAADQAFYIPAILRHVDPALFPRDAALIDSQSRLFILDEVFAWLMSATGIGLPAWFLLGYLVTLATHLAALTWLGRSIFANSWTIAAFVTLSTLRHRITKTGANSLEGFFHPRQLAFAIGLVAIAAVLRRRVMVSIVAVARRRRDPSDDGAVVQRLGGRRADRQRARAAPEAAGARRRGGGGCGDRPVDGFPVDGADGRCLALDAGGQGLRLPQRLGTRHVGRQPALSRRDWRELPRAPAPRPRPSCGAGGRRRLPVARRGISRGAAFHRGRHCRVRPAAGVPRVLDG